MNLLLLLTAVLSFTTIVIGQSVSCTSNSKCSCYKGTLRCGGETVTTMPELTSVIDIISVVFTNCRLGNVGRIPYSNATSLYIQSSDVRGFADDSFASLSQLLELEIIGNFRLGNISKSAFAPLTNLNRLVISEAGLTGLPAGFLDNFPQLQYLDLSTNSLNQLENLIGNATISLPVLSEFYCKDCSLKNIPTDFLRNKSSNLAKLTLSNNNFTTIEDDAFSGLTSLTELSLDSAGVTSITSGAFNGLKAVTTLWLGNNALTQLRNGTLQPMWSSLKVLHLQGNQLSSLINERIPWKTLNEIMLGGNLWACDCRITWMQKLDQVDHENVTCTSPANFAGKNLFQVEKEMMCEGSASNPDLPPSRGRVTVVLAVAIPAILVCLAMIGYYVWQILRNRHRQAQQKHSFKYRSVYGETVESNSRTEIMS